MPLEAHSTMHTKGIAEYAAYCSNLEELRALLLWASKKEMPVTYLGGGSNSLVSDNGIKGLTILTGHLTRCHINGELFCTRSGLQLDRAIDLAIEAGLSGLEMLGGIPGTVGGAIWGNAGTPTSTISDTLYYVDYLSKDGEIHRLQTHADEFSYRHSPFMEMEDACIYEAGFRLRPTRQTAQLRLLKERQKEKRRKARQYEYPSCGCIFKNPPGKFAGALIEQAGLKGKRIGDAMVSENHANFIVNMGNATALEVHQLSLLIRKSVMEKFGVHLEYEVRFIGEW